MFRLHVEGGMEWMFPLTLMLLFLIGSIAYVSYCIVTGKYVAIKWLETIKHAGMLALAWGALATVYGLSAMFKSLQTLKEVPPLEVLMGGLQALLIALLYALSIFIISLLAYLFLKFKVKNAVQEQN
ncbi:MotA/TolQ/ExbB proton channel family protein [Rhodocytophaga aerolata]|uniref:MotA/TolQ/ExbB proton channel family protein n=1 Tax=Rhodocytophaga aerolata TaxID=455078 RepID=A0ABT8R190_9BACT|nr:MotA/TolQ/ExbB proton channel family protein [Rhodocytophaga aerolata]MDO1445861.1 MotA/TolQ/ExbB proton channel family protein [Rhodocytophaga aerolata]